MSLIMDIPVLTISLRDVDNKPPSKAKNINLDEYMEISSKYIRFFKKCWIKYTDKSSLITYQGGFLIGCTEDEITLRNIRQEIFELNMDDYIFYCKEDTDQYQVIKELMIEKQKLEKQIEILNKEKKEFLNQKRKFFSKIKS